MSISQTDLTTIAGPVGLDAPIWRIGPIDRRAVAGLCAEIAYRVRPVMRPLTHAAIDAAGATVYLIDRYALVAILEIALDHQARQVDAPTMRQAATIAAGIGAWLTGLTDVQRWADAPGPDAARAPIDLALCRDCHAPVIAPSPLSPRLCIPCWRARISAGRRKQIAADLAWIDQRNA